MKTLFVINDETLKRFVRKNITDNIISNIEGWSDIDGNSIELETYIDSNISAIVVVDNGCGIDFNKLDKFLYPTKDIYRRGIVITTNSADSYNDLSANFKVCNINSIMDSKNYGDFDEIFRILKLIRVFHKNPQVIEDIHQKSQRNKKEIVFVDISDKSNPYEYFKWIINGYFPGSIKYIYHEEVINKNSQFTIHDFWSYGLIYDI